MSLKAEFKYIYSTLNSLGYKVGYTDQYVTLTHSATVDDHSFYIVEYKSSIPYNGRYKLHYFLMKHDRDNSGDDDFNKYVPRACMTSSNIIKLVINSDIPKRYQLV